MRSFKVILLFSAGALFFSFLFLQQYFCPREEIFFFGTLFFLFYILTHAEFLRRWSLPLEQMIEAVSSYQDGCGESLPKLVIQNRGTKNAFTPLAMALNSLTERVQKQIQESHEKDKDMEGILDSLNEGVIACNASANVIFVNQVACKMLSISRSAMVGKSLYYLGDREGIFQRCHEIVLQALQTSEPITQRWTEKDIYFDLVAAPLIHQTGAILVLQNKTSDYKVLEMGKNFIANASHELRTPITIIRGFAEMLQNVSHLSPQKKIDITDKIVRTCDRLDKLVKSLLTIADLENLSKENFRACNLISLVDNCKHLLLTAYPRVEVTVSYSSEEVSIIGDADLLDLAIMNLLENGVKYSSVPVQLVIGIRKTEHCAEIEIIDKGIGIPAVDLPHIFDRFYTVDKARSRKSGGAGLGLSIVKTIIEKHQGTVSVISEPCLGSTFTISLPLNYTNYEK